MPPIKRVNKEKILDTAFDIVRESGMKSLNTRLIAKKLNCSTQPIFSEYKNMNELKKELKEKICNYHEKYLCQNLDINHSYRTTGENYIRFAKEEPNLFNAIFADEKIDESEDYGNVIKEAQVSTGLDEKEAISFHKIMWFYTHGIATLVANNTIKLTDEQIQELLGIEFKALMLLEGKK